MSKGKQLWPGDKMQAFFRAHIRRETSLDAAAAERLAAALTKAINRMLVWEIPSETEAARPIENAPISSARDERHARAENFNPYIFSAIVVLAKHGRDGLLKRLQEIKSADNLRTFAEAQHVPVEPSIKRTDDIRRAIVAAVEQRFADRKAAAS